MYVDLHTHTTASDGEWDIEELLDRVRKKDITLFSITDHDTINSSIKMAELLKQENDIKFVVGVEISTVFHGQEHHVLGYNFDYKNKDLLKLLDRNLTKRENFFDEIFKNLELNNKELEIEKFKKYRDDLRKKYNKRGGWEVLYRFMMDEKLIDNYDEFSAIKKKTVREIGLKLNYCSAKEAIETIKSAGGYAILAHPNKFYRDSKVPQHELNEWLELGIDGMECYTCYSKEEYYDYYVDFCKNNNLLITAGSDSHGRGFRKLGIPKVTHDMIRFI